ncbi:MAG: hypothetical protein IGR93_12140 [Hydrococcus sp. C42_A2020_068]|nr:hypothetical protein [Hydrococcus sp. C42_A2020_068]
MVNTHFLSCSSLLAFSSIVALAIAVPIQAQVPPQQTEQGQGDLRPLAQPNSLLSFQGAQRLMNEANQAIGSEQYEVAVNKLQQARKIFNQLSNFHLQLANSFSGIDSQVYEAQRSSALKSGQMRDEATYQLALVHRAQNQPELSVPLLIQVIRSQNPTSDLGKKAYQQLYELGFVESPFSPSTRTAPKPQQGSPQQDNPLPGNPQRN